MTIINRKNNGQDGVAEWFYDFFEFNISVETDVTIDNLQEKKGIKMLNIIIEKLLASNLFLLSEIKITGFKKNEIKKNVDTLLDFTYKVSTNNQRKDIQSYLGLFLKELKDIEIRSIIISFDSHSLIGDEHKNIERTFILNYSTMSIKLITDCDIWLPYDLKGNPQQELYERNAPRLKKVLQEIEGAIGVEPVWDNTKYAYIDKYDLRNITDYDGNPINVYER